MFCDWNGLQCHSDFYFDIHNTKFSWVLEIVTPPLAKINIGFKQILKCIQTMTHIFLFGSTVWLLRTCFCVLCDSCLSVDLMR